MESGNGDAGLEWQVGVWDKISDLYVREIDRRFIPVIDGVISRSGLKNGERVLDLGSGTGSAALAAASSVSPEGSALGVDISPEMVAIATERALKAGIRNVEFRQGRAEELPEDDSSCDVVIASLSLMYVIDRAAAAREIGRVLKPGGRFVAAVWAGPEDCDIVLFQGTAGKFAPEPPVPGVGPGAMADVEPFLEQLAGAGIKAAVESQELGFEFKDFDSAWDALAGVTTAQLAPETQLAAKQAVREVMWQEDGARRFRNLTQFITGGLE